MKTPPLKLPVYILFGLTVVVGGTTIHAAPAPAAEQFAALAAEAEAAQRATVAGKDHWLFLTAEVRHLGVGRFWGRAAAKVSRSSRPEAADPLPVILDFQAQLKQAGIELILMPVPAKAAVYPDKLIQVQPGETEDQRAGSADDEFLEVCEQRGVTVLDLATGFRAARTNGEEPLYCRTDSHWSGRACQIAAELLAKDIRRRAWLAGVPVRTFKTESRESEFTGDLVGLAGDPGPAETIRVRQVTEASGAAPGDWRESPVLLLGDSHTLVFHAGEDMHGSGAGLADQLAAELGFPVDVVGVRGSGATPARINLLRRRDNLAGKRIVIWCFSAREFTEAPGGWRLVPVISLDKK